jgi:tRNA1(Val) A37 N6-methylase TrmN6
MDVFNDDIKFKNILQKIYDKHNGFSDSFVRNGLIIGGAYTPGNFRPLIAKYIYEKYSPDNGIVLDPCAGFGGRLLGCMASSTGHRTYIGVEPEKRNCEGLIKMKNDLNPNFNVSLFSEPFEDFDYHDEYFDLVFTSPPYYNQELYNPNNKFQSHVKYQNYDDWKVYFLWNFISQSYRSLKTNGIFAVAINDIKGHNLLDDFLTYCSMYFDLLKTYKIEYKTNPFVNAESGIAVKYEPLYIFRKKQKCNTNQKF